MNVLMFSWEYPPRIVGGIARVVHDLAAALAEKNINITVITHNDDTMPEVFRNGHVDIYSVRTYKIDPCSFTDWVHHMNFTLLEKSVTIINNGRKFDIIHAHDWLVAFAARALKHSYGIPLISTIHATEHGRNNGLHNDTQRYISGVEWWLTYESWKVIVNSNYMKREVSGIFSLPEEKIRVIPNGIDGKRYEYICDSEGSRRKYALDNEKIVLFVGRMVNEKGAQVLLDAVPKVIRYYNDVKFVFAGKGPMLDYLKYKAFSMNIMSKVLFTGYIPDNELCTLYRCCDITVFPSLYEPFGIVALEGMLAGKPVVVSDTGGLGETVEHGYDGMTAYTGNPESFADCILELLHKPELCVIMAKRAFEKVNRKYNWQQISEKTLETYKEVIKEKERQ